MQRVTNLNVLPNALPHALPYIFSEICLVLGYLEGVTTRYHHFLKKMLVYTFL